MRCFMPINYPICRVYLLGSDNQLQNTYKANAVMFKAK